MKVFFGIGIFVILCANFAYSFSSLEKRETSAEEMSSLINSLNFFRRSLAMSYNISNMHSLRYDLNLESIAESWSSCADVKVGPNYTPFYPPDDSVWQVIQNTWGFENVEQLMAREDQTALKRFVYVMLLMKDMMHPLQMTIGCAELERGCHVTLDSGLQNLLGIEKISANSVCLLGPLSTMELHHVVKGHPGANCYSGRAVNGLCTSSSGPINFHQQLGIGEEAGGSMTKHDVGNISNNINYFLAILTVFFSLK